MASGIEIPPMYGKGGMKKIFELSRVNTTPVPVPVTTSSVSNITFDDETYGSLGPSGSVHLTTLDFEKGTRTDEIIDADVYEKRKRGNYDPSRNVRPRIDDAPEVGQPLPFSQPTPAPNPTENYRTPTTPKTPPDTLNQAQSEHKKFRLASGMSEMVGITQSGEQIMDTPVQLSMRQVLAASSELSGYLHEQTRKRRVPIETTTTNTNILNSNEPTTLTTTSDVNSIRTLYACPSGYAKVNLNRTTTVDALLDDGSELNLMPRRTFESADLSIDTDIDWRVNGYDSETQTGL